jgi:hypothetical protein
MGEQVEGQEYFSVDEAAQIIGWNRATKGNQSKALDSRGKTGEVR